MYKQEWLVMLILSSRKNQQVEMIIIIASKGTVEAISKL